MSSRKHSRTPGKRNNYGALPPVGGNFVDEGPTEVGNWSWRILVVLSVFFLRLTIDGRERVHLYLVETKKFGATGHLDDGLR